MSELRRIPRRKCVTVMVVITKHVRQIIRLSKMHKRQVTVPKRRHTVKQNNTFGTK